MKKWMEKITYAEDDVKRILEDCEADTETLKADRQLERMENVEKFKSEIKSRPEKEWIMTRGEKMKKFGEEMEVRREKAKGEGKGGKKPLSRKELGKKKRLAREKQHDDVKQKVAKRLKRKVNGAQMNELVSRRKL